MPALSESARPNGLPIANTDWPVCTVDESPSVSGMSVVDGGVDLDHREVGAAVAADERALRGLAVLELHGDRGGAAHDVVVGDDVALAVDHEARALRLAGLRLLSRPKKESLLSEPLVVTTMSTTPGEVRLYRSTSEERSELFRAAGWIVAHRARRSQQHRVLVPESAMAYAPTPFPHPRQRRVQTR